MTGKPSCPVRRGAVGKVPAKGNSLAAYPTVIAHDFPLLPEMPGGNSFLAEASKKAGAVRSWLCPVLRGRANRPGPPPASSWGGRRPLHHWR
jgi:hypothetical protein